LPEQLQHLRGPAALAAILAATATTAAAHRHVYPASAADRDAYADGHAGCCQPHPDTDGYAQPDTHIHRYQRTRGHPDIHRHSFRAADGYADAAATTDGYTDTAATTANGYADAATAATDGYTDTAATTADGYTTTTANRDAATAADGYTTADQHTCSVSHSDPGRWLTQADTLILNRKTSRR
jgi:hypothetical protein